MLFQGVRVLAINQNADEKNAQPIEGRVATLELTPLDAQKLSLAQSTGDLSFTLRPAGSLDVAPAQRIAEGELGSTGAVYQAASVAADQAKAQADLSRRVQDLEGKLRAADARRAEQVVTAAKAEAPATAEDELPTTAEITIFRGLKGASYTVPLDANR